MSPYLSVVTTAFRTATVLGELVAAIAEVAADQGWDYELVVVDDGCPERSGDVAVGRERTTVWRLDANAGQRTAVLVGMSRAGGRVVAVLDGDLQDDPRSIPVLLAALDASGADVVAAGRRGRYESWRRRWTGAAFRRLRWAASGGAIPPDAGLFHVARAEAVAAMLTRTGPGDDPLVGYAVAGCELRSVPVLRRPRPSGSSAYTGRSRARLAVASLRGLLPAGPPRPLPPARKVEEVAAP